MSTKTASFGQILTEISAAASLLPASKELLAMKEQAAAEKLLAKVWIMFSEIQNKLKAIIEAGFCPGWVLLPAGLGKMIHDLGLIDADGNTQSTAKTLRDVLNSIVADDPSDDDVAESTDLDLGEAFGTAWERYVGLRKLTPQARRSEWAEYVGRRELVIGKIAKFSFAERGAGFGCVTACLTNPAIHNSRAVQADHVWLTFEDLNTLPELHVGDIVALKARIGDYRKGFFGEKTDIGVTEIQEIKVLSQGRGQTLQKKRFFQNIQALKSKNETVST